MNASSFPSAIYEDKDHYITTNHGETDDK